MDYSIIDAVYLKNNSYVRIKSIILTYSLPSETVKKLRMRGLSFNISVNNFFTFTGYDGMDPEIRERPIRPPEACPEASMSNSKESEMKNIGIFMNIFKRASALAILVSAAGCRGYLNVQPQGRSSRDGRGIRRDHPQPPAGHRGRR